MIEVKTYQAYSPSDPENSKMIISATIDPIRTIEAATAHELIHEIVRQVAEKYVSEHYAELIKNLDQQAIANLAIAESGKKIAEEIRLTPGRVNVDNRTYKSSIF